MECYSTEKMTNLVRVDRLRISSLVKKCEKLRVCILKGGLKGFVRIRFSGDRYPAYLIVEAIMEDKKKPMTLIGRWKSASRVSKLVIPSILARS